MTGRPPPHSRSAWPLPAGLLRYGLAPLSVGVALLLMFGWSLVAPADTRPALMVAVALSALYGGVGPGLLALATVVAQEPVLLLAGALLTAVCAGFRRFIRSGYRLEDAESYEIDRYGNAKHFVNNLVGIFERGQLVGAWGTQRDVSGAKPSQRSQEIRSRVHSSKSSSQ